MKSLSTLRIISLLIFFNTTMFAQNFWVPDPLFRAQLKLKLSPACFTAQDSLITNATDIGHLENLDISSKNIYDLDGIQFLSSLKNLDCSHNLIDTISQLPDSLLHFKCADNELIQILQLPSSLTYFNCYGNQLAGLPSLPDSLNYLNCSACNFFTSGTINLSSLPTSLDTLLCTEMRSTSLPALPNSLKRLDCSNNLLTALPLLPGGLISIDYRNNLLTQSPLIPGSVTDLSCGLNPLTSLPNLPSGLRIFSCDNLGLTTLPLLPNSLEVLFCNDNNLTSLNLPPSLYDLFCYNNKLTSLPNLPASLSQLTCFRNQLTSLPPLPLFMDELDCSENFITGTLNLPQNLAYLTCYSNQISSLSSIPATVEEIYCQNNQITNLPKLPTNLLYFNCSNNPLSCLPPLPQALLDLTDTNTFISCIPNFPTNAVFTPANPQLCDTAFPTCYYGYVKGYVFNDANGNGIKNVNETGIPVEVSYASVNSVQSDTSGFFRAYCENVSTTFQISVPKYYSATTPNPYTVSVPSASVTVYFGLNATINVNDMDIDITPHNPFRPGFNTCTSIHYQNVGTNSLSNAIVKFLRPSALTNLGAVPPPTSFNGDTLIWNIGALASARDGYISLWDSVSATTTIGDTISLQAWIEPLSGDSTPADNYFISNSIATGSFDPNDKSVSNDSIFTNTTAYLEYTIRFQNTGTDTAFTVIVTDTLFEDLNISTIETLSSSHKNTFWVEHRTAKWYFANILLPDSNVNEASSHGFVKFRIKPKANLGAGIQIPNTANIYFDYNTAVVTNTIVVDVTPLSVPLIADEKLQLFPNPVHQMVHLKGSNSKPLGKVTLVNSEGKIIESKTISSSTYEWQVEQLPAGIYIFKGEYWKEKILKK